MFVKSQEYSAKEKKDLFEELSDGRVVSPRDVLLNKAVGRYLWFFFEMEAGYKYYINRLTFRFSVQSYTVTFVFREVHNPISSVT